MEKNISTFKELQEICGKTGKPIWEVIQIQEAELAETSVEELRVLVKRSLDAMKDSIKSGLKSKEMSISGMCGDDCDRLQKRFVSEQALFGKTFEKKIITQRKNDILYEWKFDNAKESEIARIIYTPQGIYHVHCAKKGAFTNEEKAKAIDLLKTAVLK